LGNQTNVEQFLEVAEQWNLVCTVVLYIRVPGTMLLLLSTRAYLGPGIRDEGHSFQVTRQRNIKINCENTSIGSTKILLRLKVKNPPILHH
jgi:hypothetical protein